MAGWIDVHSHFARPDDAAGWQAQPALDHMEEMGVGLQMLSDLSVTDVRSVRESNAYGATIVRRFPDRFGLLASLPLSDPAAALHEIDFAADELGADGFVLCATNGGHYLGAPQFRQVWRALSERGATVFIHPSPFAVPALDLPMPLFEVAFDTARTVVDMLWNGFPAFAPSVKVILAHAGGALPALAGRIELLANADWISPRADPAAIRDALSEMYYDTAMSGSDQSLGPLLGVTSADHIVYGSDFGAPCARGTVLQRTLASILTSKILSRDHAHRIGSNADALFPDARERMIASASRQPA